MASSTLSQEEENYVRMSLLLTGISPCAVRVLFDKEFPPASLSLTVNDKKVKQKLNDLSRKRVIDKAQWDLLFPTSGITDSNTFDVTLMIALLRNLTTLTSPIQGYDKLPGAVETTPASDLARIKHYRNSLAHLNDAKVDGTLFNTAWKDISDAVFRLGGNAMKQECDQLMTKPLDKSSHEILREVQQAKKDIESIKQSLQNGQREVRLDVQNIKSDYEILKTSQDLLQSDQIKAKEDVKKLTSRSEDPVPWNRRGI
ncbi:E3 ubiquitin-protein ligase DZIP3-like [Mytilus galloprovincialis]|uniref:E3 ubiquitin-protein ligase DZIP3-like n=1 Tax=Mytilus galloprovincialis TaxID=29158 RepID=UPI003F7C944F